MESAANVRSATGARIRHIRGGMTQERFGTQFGVSTATVRNYETGRDPSAEFLAALAGEGWSINWLLTGEGPERIGGSGHRIAEPAAQYCDTSKQVASQDLSAEHLSIALELADEALRGLWLPRRQYAELVDEALVYAALMQGLPFARVLEMARPAARDRAGAQGADDGGEQGVDRTGPAGSGRGAAG